MYEFREGDNLMVVDLRVYHAVVKSKMTDGTYQVNLCHPSEHLSTEMTFEDEEKAEELVAMFSEARSRCAA